MKKLKKLLCVVLFTVVAVSGCGDKALDSPQLNNDPQMKPNGVEDNAPTSNDNEDTPVMSNKSNSPNESDDPIDAILAKYSDDKPDSENIATEGDNSDKIATQGDSDSESTKKPYVNIYEPSAEKNDPSDTSKKSWGFRRNADHEPPEVQLDFNLTAYDAYYLGDTTEKIIYLTFDQGYENGLTSKILDVLKANNVPAAFFVVGTYVKSEADLIKRMVDEGHLVGNHSANHASFPTLSDEKVKQELEETEVLFKEVTGQQMPKFFRPPSGEYSQKSLSAVKNLGYKTIFWSFAYMDWDVNNQPGADVALKMSMDNSHNGSIMLLHSVSQSNADALDDIIKNLKAEGYTFKSLDSFF